MRGKRERVSLNKRIALRAAPVNWDIDIAGYLVEKSDSGSVELPPKWLGYVRVLLGFMSGVSALSYLIGLDNLGPGDILVSALFLGILLFGLGSLALKISESLKTLDAAEKIAKNGKVSQNTVELSFDTLEQGVAVPVGDTPGVKNPRPQTVTGLVKYENTIHYAHFSCVPEEGAWIESFELAMQLK